MTTLPLIARTITDAENRWTDVRALLSFLTTALTVKVPEDKEVALGLELPSGSYRPTLFIRTTALGDFAGLYAYVGGEYRRIDNFPHTGEIRGIANYVVGTTELEPGWYLADGENGTINRSSHFSGTTPNFSYAEIQYTGVIS